MPIWQQQNHDPQKHFMAHRQQFKNMWVAVANQSDIKQFVWKCWFKKRWWTVSDLCNLLQPLVWISNHFVRSARWYCCHITDHGEYCFLPSLRHVALTIWTVQMLTRTADFCGQYLLPWQWPRHGHLTTSPPSPTSEHRLSIYTQTPYHFSYLLIRIISTTLFLD